ncbi:hypothetical protein BT96DRAFT_945701 [Gymnopus androsaceus JB14]|uniref:Uncharacterized protein n=1 Tax=Gymnopus androsaceus JB14 TaxID=1447944 RepID=A0A6A4H048_9AGAR|nr:hypothetical protein BT96DRAFT_945701 [Gymnopus androsaceus JB14]
MLRSCETFKQLAGARKTLKLRNKDKINEKCRVPKETVDNRIIYLQPPKKTSPVQDTSRGDMGFIRGLDLPEKKPLSYHMNCLDIMKHIRKSLLGSSQLEVSSSILAT